jgi:hypothetical protein
VRANETAYLNPLTSLPQWSTEQARIFNQLYPTSAEM